MYRYALLFALSLVAFGAALAVPFFYDDHVIIQENQLLRSSDGLTTIWQGHVDDRRKMDGAYRPLLLTFFRAAGQLTDFSPLLLRLTTLALHALNAFLLLLLAQRFGGISTLGAWLVSILFLLHPIQTTSMAMVWKQSDVWIALGSLASLYFWGRFKGLSFLVFLFCLGFKESALIIPLLWLVAEAIQPSEGRKKRLIVIALGLLTSFLFYRLLGSLSKAPEVLDGFPAGRFSYFWTQLLILPLYAKNLFWPTALTIDRSVSVAAGPTISSLLTLLSLLSAIGFASYRALKKSKPAVFFLLGIVWLIPTSSFQPLSLPYDETRFYLTIGFFALALVTWLSPRLRGAPLRPLLAWGLLGTFVVLLIFLTNIETRRFQSEEKLWLSALQVDPTSVRAHYQLGFFARKGRFLDEAEAHHRAALALNPGFPNSRLELGITLGQKGDLDGAAEQFSQLLSFAPYWAARGHYHLGLDAIYKEDFAKAEREFREVAKLLPDSDMIQKGETFIKEERARLAGERALR